jgi:CRP-like cAMP-binding protein
MARDDIIFSKFDDSKEAYILRKGSIIYEILPEYTFTIHGTDKIFGVSEILLESKYDLVESRRTTIKEGTQCDYSTIPKENLLKMITEYNIGWNTGKHLTEIITHLHKIVIELEKEMKEDEKENKELLATYAEIVHIYIEASKKKNFDWLKEFVEQIESNPMYKKGIQFIEVPSKIEIDDSQSLDKFKKTYKNGDVICKKGDDANELYILSEGKIKISLDDDTVIDVISDKGSVIGEMAILLNDKRTANMTAIDNTILISINRNEIKDLFKSESEIFTSTLVNLSMREAYNVNYINNLYEIVKQEPNKKRETIEKDKKHFEYELKKLKEDILKLTNDYNHYKWLEDLKEKADIKFKEVNI